jgi:hypothetical protein
VAHGRHRLTHPPLESLVAFAVVVVVVVVVLSLAALIGSLSSITPVEPTFPDLLDRPLLVMVPSELDLHLV